MPRGERGEGAGSKTQGITRKVLLTEEQWNQIEATRESTVAAYIEGLMNKVTSIRNETDSIYEIGSLKHNKHQVVNRKEVEEYWSIFVSFVESAAPEVLLKARKSYLRVLYPKGEDTAQIEIKPNFGCPFTGKRFGSEKAMIKAAVPHLVQSVSMAHDRKSENRIK
ncbi:hypothetical protein PAT3040_00713 [Paenibacillus agaridevorans]|uniref:Uncharacterized protein n=1 Tax=Paenibacillus agaridevorans TaxID=171404 RepID=A0A2R5EHZ5_9BACL|nr:hypothetical protein [Paenibacillus agaridevorans]GBG06200.1 hypothetical protein PAT3040_00713 [Paenibacillus agaridevorans]